MKFEIKNSKLRVLAIDPRFERLGLAIIEKKRGGKEILLYSSCFTTSAKIPFEKRIFLIGQEVARVIKVWQPEALAIETLFLTTNQKTAMRVAEARGVILYESKVAGLYVKEFTPLQVKIAVTGYGRADKGQVALMVKKLLVFKDKKTKDDEFDAVAVGLTFFAHHRYPHPPL